MVATITTISTTITTRKVDLVHLQAAFAKCLLDEVVDSLQLSNAVEALVFYWIPTLRDPGWRAVLQRRALTMLKPPQGESGRALCSLICTCMHGP